MKKKHPVCCTLVFKVCLCDIVALVVINSLSVCQFSTLDCILLRGEKRTNLVRFALSFIRGGWGGKGGREVVMVHLAVKQSFHAVICACQCTVALHCGL